MGVLDLLNPLAKKKEEEPRPDTGAKPLTITFARGPSTLSGPRHVVSFGLTPLGKQKIRTLDESDARFQILACIEENGPSTIGEIADRIHLSTAKTSYIVTGKDGLLRAGCLKTVGMGGE